MIPLAPAKNISHIETHKKKLMGNKAQQQNVSPH
jgi:hypothetical protein